MTVALKVSARGFVNARRVLDNLSSLNTRNLLDNIGEIVEGQVRNRILHERESPEGEAWAPWSEKYKKTRGSGHELLQDEGDLRDSITHNVLGGELEIGSNLVYARKHQKGSEDGTTPARPYLGLSRENEDDIEEAVGDWIEKVLRR